MSKIDRALRVAKQHGGAAALPLTGSPGQGATEAMYQGPIRSHVPGRTDRHEMDVKSGSYVVPADVVSIVGQGNTEAGNNIWKLMMMGLPKGGRPGIGAGLQHMPALNLGKAKLMKHAQAPKTSGYGTGYAPGQGRQGGGPVVLPPSRRKPTIADRSAGALEWRGAKEEYPNWVKDRMVNPDSTPSLSPNTPESFVRGMQPDTNVFLPDEIAPRSPNPQQPGPPDATYGDEASTGGGREMDGPGGRVPIIAAGGEIVLSPEEIMHKFGDLDRGHKTLDEVVLKLRDYESKRLRTTPPPKK
jgi:hypothetical protein